MDLGLATLEMEHKALTKPPFLSEEEWQQVEQARQVGVSFRRLFGKISATMKAAGRPFYSSRDSFCRSFYLWRNGEKHETMLDVPG